MTFTWEDVLNATTHPEKSLSARWGGGGRRGITIHDRNVQESL